MSINDTLTADKDGNPVTASDYTQLNTDVDENANGRDPSKARQLLLLFSCLYLRCLSFGVGYALSVMYVDVIKHLRVPRKQASLIQSVFTVMLFGASFFVSLIITKFGPGISVILGAILSTIGFLASGFLLDSIAGVIVCTGIIAGFGSSMMLTATWTTVAWSFREKKPLALMVLSFGSSVGTFLFPYIAEIALQQCHLKGAFIVLACTEATAIPIGAFLYTCRYCFERGEEKTAAACNLSFFRMPLYLGYLFANALIGFSMIYPYILVDMVVEYGFGRTKGAYVESVFGVAGLLGQLLSILVIKMSNVPTITHWSFCCVLTGVGHLLLSAFHHYWLVMVVSIVSGMTIGIMATTASLTILEIVGLEFFPRARGMAAVVWGTSIFAGIFFTGAMKDNGWSYGRIYYILAGILLAGSAFCLLISVFTWRAKPRDTQEIEIISKDSGAS